MINIYIIDSFLFFLQKSQQSFKLWVSFNYHNFILIFCNLLYKANIILGYIIKANIILIFLKYIYLKPLFLRYKLFFKPTKKKLMKTIAFKALQKKTKQSFFFFKYSSFFLGNYSQKYIENSNFLLVKIN